MRGTMIFLLMAGVALFMFFSFRFLVGKTFQSNTSEKEIFRKQDLQREQQERLEDLKRRQQDLIDQRERQLEMQRDRF